MSKESFKKPAEQQAEPEKQVVVRPETQVSVPTQQFDDMAGNWEHSDVRLPRVNLIHKTSDSELIEKFGIGSFSYNKEVKLSDGKTPVAVVALRSAKDYVQKLPYGDPEQPAVFKTPEEVTANGGSLNYKDFDSGNFYQPRAHIQLIVEKPAEADEALFPYEFGDKIYGAAILTVSSSAYTSVGKELATLRSNNRVMRKGLRYGKLELTSAVKKNAKNSWSIPVIKYSGENSEELVKFFEGLM